MIQALQDYVLIEPIKEDVTASGIILSDKDKSSKGIVKAVWAGKITDSWIVPLDISVGDTIYFNKHGVSEITLDDETYTIARYDSIFAKKVL